MRKRQQLRIGKQATRYAAIERYRPCFKNAAYEAEGKKAGIGREEQLMNGEVGREFQFLYQRSPIVAHE